MTGEILKWLDDFWGKQYVINKDDIGYGLYAVIHSSPEAVTESYQNLCCSELSNARRLRSLRHVLERRINWDD